MVQGGEKNKRYSEKKIDGLSAGQSYDGIPFCKEKRNPSKYDLEYLEIGSLRGSGEKHSENM